MLKAGITGGIGSGKSTVADIFSSFGIPVFHSDLVARRLMEEDPALRQQIQIYFGKESYQNGRLNRSFLAHLVFKDEQKLQQLNTMVHPAVIAYGKAWSLRQTTPYVIKESALFFESGSFRDIDFMIGVSVPENIRIARVKQRDGLSEEAIKARMKQQMAEQEKMSRCDVVILNDGHHSLIKQVQSLHQKLLAQATAGKD